MPMPIAMSISTARSPHSAPPTPARLLQLPCEVIQLIIKHLDISDFYLLATSCKATYYYFNSPHHRRLLEYTIHNLDPFIPVDCFSNNCWRSTLQTFNKTAKTLQTTLDISDLDSYVSPDTIGSPNNWRRDKLPETQTTVLQLLSLSNNYVSFDYWFDSSKCHIVTLSDDFSLMDWITIDFKTGRFSTFKCEGRPDRTLISPFADASGLIARGGLREHNFNSNFTMFLSSSTTTAPQLETELHDDDDNDNNISAVMPESGSNFRRNRTFLPWSTNTITSTFSPLDQWKLQNSFSFEKYRFRYCIYNDCLYLFYKDGRGMFWFCAYQKNPDPTKCSKLLWKTSLNPTLRNQHNNRSRESDLDFDGGIVKYFIPHKDYLFFTIHGWKKYSSYSTWCLLRENGHVLGVYDLNHHCHFSHVTDTHIFFGFDNYIMKDANQLGVFQVVSKPLTDFLSELDTKSFKDLFSYHHEHGNDSLNSVPKGLERFNYIRATNPNNVKKDWTAILKLESDNEVLTSTIKGHIYVGSFEIHEIDTLRDNYDCYYQYLFLYNFETGEKRYYKIRDLVSNGTTILVTDDLEVISLSEKYIKKLVAGLNNDQSQIELDDNRLNIRSFNFF